MAAGEWQYKTPSFNTFNFSPIDDVDKFGTPWKVLWKGVMKVSSPTFHGQIVNFTSVDDVVIQREPDFINGQGEW